MENIENNLKDNVGFETVPTQLQFQCHWAVYRIGDDSSICYVTSKMRGDLIVAALDAFVQSGEAERWLKNQNAIGEARADNNTPNQNPTL
jgi:hypothetical protein